MSAMSEFSYEPQIVASGDQIEAGRIQLDRPDRYACTLGGTALLRECGEQRATMSFLGVYEIDPDPHENTSEYDPIIFIMNGGPSAPAILWNWQILGLPFEISHDVRGNLSERDFRIGSASSGRLTKCGEAVAIDPIETGLGRVAEGVDPDWAFNSETDSQATAAVIELYCKMRSKYGERPVILFGSSFRARQLPLTILDLEKRGIRVDGVVIASGHFDASMTDYNNKTDPRPFVNALPALAIAAHQHVSTAFPESTSAEEIFDTVRGFAEGEYTRAVSADKVTGRRQREIAERLGALTGLALELVLEHDLLLSPDLLTSSLLPGRLISSIDSRLTFDASAVTPNAQGFRTDPALDQWEKFYMRGLRNPRLAHAYPLSKIDDGYRGTIQVPQWRHNGLVADGRSHEAWAEVLKHNPKIVIRAYSGFFDLNTPPPSTEVFFNELGERVNFGLRKYRADTYSVYDDNPYRQPGVELFTLPMGHQLVRPGIHDPRDVVLSSISRLLSGKWQNMWGPDYRQVGSTGLFA